MIYAIVKDGKTINVIEWDGEAKLDLPEGEILVPQNQAPEYLPKIENHSIPSTITPAQLVEDGIVLQNQAPEYLPEIQNILARLAPGLPEIQNPSVPSTISPVQLRIWLIRNGLGMGLGMSIIETLLDGIKDDKSREEAKIRWEFGLSISKEDQVFKLLGNFMILTEAQKEQMMLEASMIV